MTSAHKSPPYHKKEHLESYISIMLNHSDNKGYLDF